MPAATSARFETVGSAYAVFASIAADGCGSRGGAWDPAAVAPLRRATPDAMADDALRRDARVLVSTYNEPLITAEWAVEIFKTSKQAWLLTGFVSNGNATPRARDYLRPWGLPILPDTGARSLERAELGSALPRPRRFGPDAFE